MSTLLFLVDGIGRDKYMNYYTSLTSMSKKKRHYVSCKKIEFDAMRRDLPCDKSCTLADSGTVLGKVHDDTVIAHAISLPFLLARDLLAEASRAPLPEPSVTSYVGLLRMRFRSSCNPSSKKLRNSCESCCSEPPNCVACMQMER